MSISKEDRRLRIAQIREKVVKENSVPDAKKEAWLNRFVEGDATWADLFDHAYDYVTTSQEREKLRISKEDTSIGLQQLHDKYEASAEVYKEEQQQTNIRRRGMTKGQRERYEAIDAAQANVRLSGGKIGEDHLQQTLRFASGEITLDEYLALRMK